MHHSEESNNQKETKYVPQTLFFWALGVIMIIYGILANAEVALSNKLADHEKSEQNILQEINDIKVKEATGLQNDQYLKDQVDKIINKLNIL